MRREPAATETATSDGPRVLLVARHHLYALQIAAELSRDLDATVIGVGGRPSPISRSRYCDAFERVVASEPAAFGEAIVDVAATVDPDVVLPVGQLSVRALDAVRDSLPAGVACRLPPRDALATALRKPATADAARAVGVDVPETIATLDPAEPLDAQVDPTALSYPVFLKAAEEAGTNHVASVDAPGALARAFDDLRDAVASHQSLLLQESVNATGRTYGCGMLFLDGRCVLSFCQEELRSIPREGGTGTRVRRYRDPALERATRRLLASLSWEGLALVEYTKRTSGEYALMEINPKFWSSYPLASRTGFRFASTLVAAAVDPPLSLPVRRRTDGEMVFPIRELYHVLSNPGDESLLEAAGAMAWPPASVDVRLRDLPAWIAPGGVGTSLRWLVDLARGEDGPV